MNASRQAMLAMAVWVWLWSGDASAQASRLATQTLHCSAVLQTLAQTQDGQPQQAQRLQRGADTLLEVHLKEMGATDPAAQAQAQRQRAQDQAQMQASRAERADYFREDAVVCGAWAEGFLAQGERYQFLVVYPKVIAPHIRSQYQALADQTLQRWAR